MRIRFALAIFFIIRASLGFAQTTDTASVRAIVVDANGAPLGAASATLENSETGAHRRGKTDAHGEITFGAVPVSGAYRLRISRSGFEEATQGPFVLRAGETATFRTALSVLGVKAAMTVYGTAEGVRSDSPELGTRLDARALREVPVFGRKLTTLPLLNSAVRPARGTGDLFLNNTLFVINGGGRRQTTYSIDGSTGDDAWGRQTIFTNLPLSTIQEFTVLTNAFSSEYGRTTGAAINVITQSGTNALKGDLVGLYRPKSLQPKA